MYDRNWIECVFGNLYNVPYSIITIIIVSSVIASKARVEIPRSDNDASAIGIIGVFCIDVLIDIAYGEIVVLRVPYYLRLTKLSHAIRSQQDFQGRNTS